MKLDNLRLKKLNSSDNSELVELEEIDSSSIAIIGMSVKLPNADSISEFWNSVILGKDCTGEFPEARRIDIENYYSFKYSEEMKLKFAKGAFLNEIDKFDYNFFRLTPKEASLMNPSQRLFLQTVWEAIEDAGYGREMLSGTETGVYVGYSGDNDGHKYWNMIYDIEGEFNQMGIPGNMTSVIPSRISYFLDLRGPTLVVDTACSSSLVAVHMACKGLINGDCDMAIAAGVKIRFMPIEGEGKIGIESSDGRTKTFDESSDGTGLGEGIGVVFLKPLGRALIDNDNIYAVIKSSAINQDGLSSGITTPNVLAQSNVITKAWRNGNIDPETISYIEAHGTGTNIGDPIEIEGIVKAFRRFTDKKQFCAIGSVKTNIGHLFEAAGIISLIKSALALKYKQIPPTINFKRPNRKINFIDSPVYVNDKPRPWEKNGSVRRCGVSAYGFSGTNCHVILEEVPETEEVFTQSNRFYIFTVSAKTESSLLRIINKYNEYFSKVENHDLKRICYTTNVGRGHYEYRISAVVKDLEELKDKLAILGSGDFSNLEGSGIHFGVHKSVKDNLEYQSGSGEVTIVGKKSLFDAANCKLNEYIEKGSSCWELLEEICRLYASGADIKWDSFFNGEKVKKISLPVYQFEHKRCWLNVPMDTNYHNHSNAGSGLYYSIKWKKEDLAGKISAKCADLILIFMDDKGIGCELSSKLRLEGNRVIDITLGKGFGKIGESSYEIANTEIDYKLLLNELKVEGLVLLIHMFTLSQDSSIDSINKLEHSQEKGVYSLFYLTRAVIDAGIRNIEMFLLSEFISEVTSSEEKICPENASYFGLGRVIDQEYPGISCKCIDIGNCTDSSTILTELSFKTRENYISYRNGIRYVEEFNELNMADFDEREFKLKLNGVYVITGGTGGIGLEVGKYFASKEKINLVFINRSKLPDQSQWDEILERAVDLKLCSKIKAVRDIEKLGSRVHCYSADISEYDQVKSVLDSIRERYGDINGVVHSAGVAGDGFIVNKSEDVFKTVLAPKVYGTWILHQLTNEDALDFFIMFSSVASMFSVPGQGDYAAANSFMDSFAAFRNRLGKRTMTVNWVAWKETGMAVDFGANMDTLFKAIPTSTAMDAFVEVLNRDVNRLLIGELNYKNESVMNMLKDYPISLSAEIVRRLERGRDGEMKKQESRNLPQKGNVVLTGRETGIYSETEKKVGQIWYNTLGFKEINIFDNFFELGGDSIAATKVVNHINNSFENNLVINIKEILDCPTVAEFSAYYDKKSGGTEGYQNNKICKVEKRDYYPVSMSQRRTYIANQFFNNDITYNISFALRIEGELDINKSVEIFRQLVKRHESFRTSFDFVNGELIQRIHEEVNFDIPILVSSEDKVDELIKDFIRPFDLSRAPLIRIELIKVADNKYVIVFDIHHIITDFASLGIIIKEFKQLYEGNELPEINIQYKDYSIWHNELLKLDKIKKQEEYWLGIFQGETPKLNMPTDFPRPQIQTSEGVEIIFNFDSELKDELNKFAKKSGATLYMVLLTAFNVLLSKYSQQEDILIGMPVLGRNNKELEGIIGMFVSVLVLRNYPEHDKTFYHFLQEVVKNTVEAFENQDYQVEDLAEKKGIKRELSRNPLFDVLFNMKNMDVPETDVAGLKITPYEIKVKVARFDIAIIADEYKDGIEFRLAYSSELFKKETMQKLAVHYENIICEVLKNPYIKINDINMFTEEERAEFKKALDKKEQDIMDDIEFDF